MMEGFGLADVLMTILGNHPDRSFTCRRPCRAALRSAFWRPTLTFHCIRYEPEQSLGTLISLPNTLGLYAYAGVLGTGLVFGGLSGWARLAWVKE